MRFSLLGIAHPIMGKCFQVLEVHRENTSKILVVKRARLWFYSFLVKFLAENPIFGNVRKKFFN